jgi:large subunit ribosomal protein L10
MKTTTAQKATVEEKQKLVEEIESKLAKSSALYLVDYLGLTVEEVTDLRQRFRAENVYFKVLKNTLVKRALAKRSMKAMDEYLLGPTAVVISLGDEIAPAKIIIDFAKKQKKNLPKLKAGVLGGQVFNNKEIEQISKLPGRKGLLSMLASVLNAPVTKLAGTLQALVTQIAYAVNAVKEKKEKETAT